LVYSSRSLEDAYRILSTYLIKTMSLRCCVAWSTARVYPRLLDYGSMMHCSPCVYVVAVRHESPSLDLHSLLLLHGFNCPGNNGLVKFVSYACSVNEAARCNHRLNAVQCYRRDLFAKKTDKHQSHRQVPVRRPYLVGCQSACK